MIWVYIYAVFMAWVMLGSGFRLPMLMYWERRHIRLNWKIRACVIIEGILLWPICKSYDELELKFIDQ